MSEIEHDWKLKLVWYLSFSEQFPVPFKYTFFSDTFLLGLYTVGPKLYNLDDAGTVEEQQKPTGARL